MPFKKVSLLAVTALSILALAACDMDDDKIEETQTKTSQVTKKDPPAVKPAVTLSEEEAKKKAFDAAKVSEGEVTHFHLEQDFDDETPSYEIDFVKDTTEYSYTIDANTGDILEQSTEPVND